MEELKDIKGIVEVPDSSLLYLFLALFALSFLVAFLTWVYVQFAKPKRRRTRRLTPKELAKQALREIDFTDTKESVYSFSENAQFLSPKHPALLALLPKLEDYKFRKEVPKLSDVDIESMKHIIEELTDDK